MTAGWKYQPAKWSPGSGSSAPWTGKYRVAGGDVHAIAGARGAVARVTRIGGERQRPNRDPRRRRLQLPWPSFVLRPERHPHVPVPPRAAHRQNALRERAPRHRGVLAGVGGGEREIQPRPQSVAAPGEEQSEDPVAPLEVEPIGESRRVGPAPFPGRVEQLIRRAELGGREELRLEPEVHAVEGGARASRDAVVVVVVGD